MEQTKCKKCDKSFKNEHALKIHIGRTHGAKVKKAAKRGRRRKVRKGAPTGNFTCGVCGRTFRLAMHLARHASAAHGKSPRRAGRAGRTAAAVVAVGAALDVRGLSIDRLLGLKRQIDQRLKDVVRQMRLAKVKV